MTHRWLANPALLFLFAFAPIAVRADGPQPEVAVSPGASGECTAPHVPVEQQPGTVRTDDLRRVTEDLKKLRVDGKLDPKEVLVVFDIDNTLLAMDSLLGSDEWFNLQYVPYGKAGPDVAERPVYDGALPNTALEPAPPTFLPERWRSVESSEHLLDLQAALFVLRPMRKTQPDASDLVASLGDRGYTVIALTSRGPSNRYATQRELKRANFSFKDHALAVEGAPAIDKEFEWSASDAAGVLSAYELAIGGGTGKIAGRRIRYSDGVMMTSGANKGFALRMLLAGAKKEPAGRFKRIVFVDDTAKHHVAIRDAFACRPSFVVATYWYVREHACVRALYADPCVMERLVDEVHRLESPAGAACGDLNLCGAR